MTTPYICTNCLSLNPKKQGAFIVCSDCDYRKDFKDYKNQLQDAKAIVRYGYQYRLQYERDYERTGNLNGRYCLNELDKVFVFLALAVISGIVGNYSYDKLKELINSIKTDDLILTINDKAFKSLLNDEQEIDKFIKYIEEYRNQKLNTYPLVIDAINEENNVEKHVKKYKSSPEYKRLIQKFSEAKKAKRKTGKK